MDIERHSRARQIELGRSLLGRRKVYLDACFWIALRDAELGRRTGAGERKLLHFLRRGVRSGALVCPISATMFLELMKQPHTLTRRQATARLIDELSLGVTAIDPRRLLGTEIYRFLLQARGEDALHPMQELIWTKVAYVLGEQYPTFAGLPQERELAIQERFFDHLWDRPLAELIELIGDEKWDDGYRRLSEEVNERNRLHRDELRSFEGAYDVELRGYIEIAGEIAADVIAELASRDAGRPLVPTSEERMTCMKMCRNLLYHAMKRPESRTALRTLHVGASIHAGMRWDKERRFKPNDWYDFGHAEVALTYCDGFLTEGPLHVLVTRPQLDLEKVNGCRVVSDLSQAAELIRVFLR